MRLKPSTAVALLALVLTLAGGARAIVRTVTGADIQPHSLTSADIRSRSISSSNLAVGAVRHINIAHNQVETEDLHDAAVTTDKLANGAVTAAKLTLITAPKIARGAVTGAAVAPNSLTNSKLVAHSIGSRELSPDGPIIYVGAAGAPPYLPGGAPVGSAATLVHPQPDEGRAGFYKDATGAVHLVGAYLGLTSSAGFVLPPGYRPPVDLVFQSRAVNAADVLVVDTDGQVRPFTQAQVSSLGSGTIVDLQDLILLQGISWRPDQQGTRPGG